MVQYYPWFGSSRVLKSIIILMAFLVIAAVSAVLLSPFLPHGLGGSLTVLFLIGIITIISGIIARTIGLEDPRSHRQKRVTTLLCFGFASFFGYAALIVLLLGHPLRFPSNLPLLLAIILAAVLTALSANFISKKFSFY